jgi:hypothetical protein
MLLRISHQSDGQLLYMIFSIFLNSHVCVSIKTLFTNKGRAYGTVSDPLSYYIVFCCRLRMSDVEVIPPEGKTSFSGIPESQFIDDVALYMKVINPVWLRLS